MVKRENGYRCPVGWGSYQGSGDLLGRSRRPVSPKAVFTATLIVASFITGLLVGPPTPEAELPWPDLVRDVVYERQAVDAAVDRADPPDGHARTPGAVALLLPLALVPSEYLTLAASIVSVVSIALVASGAVRLFPPLPESAAFLVIALPVSLAFTQAIFHGSVFLPIAASLVWMWVFISEGQPIIGGSLLAMAGVSRLWPFLLVAVLVRRKQGTALWATLGGAALLTTAGLLLPGITVTSAIDAVMDGGARWIHAEHNGSMASWLTGLGSLQAAVLGFCLALVLWLVGLRRSSTLNSDIAWTLPAAILASPLAWLPYLITLTPILLVRTTSRATRLAIGFAVAMQVLGFVVTPLLGFGFLPHQVSMTLTLLLVAGVCWRELLQGDADLRPGRSKRRGNLREGYAHGTAQERNPA